MTKKILAILCAAAMLISMTACGSTAPAETTQATIAATQPETTAAPTEAAEVTVTDMIGREVTVIPGSYKSVVCIGAGALRMYSYIGDVTLLGGVEDIDNTTLEDRPKMFDAVARPYVLAFGDVFNTLPLLRRGRPPGSDRRGGENSFLRPGYCHFRVRGRGEGGCLAGAAGCTGHYSESRIQGRV